MPLSGKGLTLGEPVLSTDSSPFPEGQGGVGRGVRTGQIAGGLVDLSGFSLGDLRDLRDARDRSCLAQALSRVLDTTGSARSNSFNSKI